MAEDASGKANAAPPITTMKAPDLYGAESKWLSSWQWTGWAAGFIGMTAVDLWFRRRNYRSGRGILTAENSSTIERVINQAIPLAAGMFSMTATSTTLNVLAVANKLPEFPRSHAAEVVCPTALTLLIQSQKDGSAGAGGTDGVSASSMDSDFAPANSNSAASSAASAAPVARPVTLSRASSAVDAYRPRYAHQRFFHRVCRHCIDYSARIKRDSAAAAATAAAAAATATASSSAATTTASTSGDTHSTDSYRVERDRDTDSAATHKPSVSRWSTSKPRSSPSSRGEIVLTDDDSSMKGGSGGWDDISAPPSHSSASSRNRFGGSSTDMKSDDTEWK